MKILVFHQTAQQNTFEVLRLEPRTPVLVKGFREAETIAPYIFIYLLESVDYSHVL